MATLEAPPSDEPTPEQRSAWAVANGRKGAAARAAKRKQAIASSANGNGNHGKAINGASITGTMPDASTRQGRVDTFLVVVKDYHAGKARAPECISALAHLSKIYGDKEAVEDERTKPSPAAVAAWIVRQVLHGVPLGVAVSDLDALESALRDALGVRVTIARKGAETAQPTPPVGVGDNVTADAAGVTTPTSAQPTEIPAQAIAGDSVAQANIDVT
jgi:hypothetical protein